MRGEVQCRGAGWHKNTHRRRGEHAQAAEALRFEALLAGVERRLPGRARERVRKLLLGRERQVE